MSKASDSNNANALKVLARITFLDNCASRILDGKGFPDILGYLPSHVTFCSRSSVDLHIYNQPTYQAESKTLKITTKHKVMVSSLYEYSKDALWAKIQMIMIERSPTYQHSTNSWIILHSFNKAYTFLEEIVCHSSSTSNSKQDASNNTLTSSIISSSNHSYNSSIHFTPQQSSDVDDGAVEGVHVNDGAGVHVDDGAGVHVDDGAVEGVQIAHNVSFHQEHFSRHTSWLDLVDDYYLPFNPESKSKIDEIILDCPNLMRETRCHMLYPKTTQAALPLSIQQPPTSQLTQPPTLPPTQPPSQPSTQPLTQPPTQPPTQQPTYSFNERLDESLCKLVSTQQDLRSTQLHELVNSIKVSSGESSKENLLTTYSLSNWQSDEGVEHFIEISIKPGIIIKKLGLLIDVNEMDYFPVSIITTGGYPGFTTTRLAEIPAAARYEDPPEKLWLFEEQKQYFEVIRINFKIVDSRDISSINIAALLFIQQTSSSYCLDFWKEEYYLKYPMIASIPPPLLYHRQLIFKRIMGLFEQCIVHLYPSPFPNQDTSPLNVKLSEAFQHLFPLSKSRIKLVDKILKSTSSKNIESPSIELDRHLLNDNASIPHEDSVFYQIYTQIKPHKKPSSYRFSEDYRQWWCCTFKMEGVSDSGGGFRDSLTSLSDDLCPRKEGLKSVFALFLPSPNQNNPDTTEYKDEYIPNGSCERFDLYHWIGLLMAGCFRSSNILSINLPRFFWKLLVGYKATWQDYMSVDHKEVMRLESIEKMCKEDFETYFCDSKSFTCVTSDGRTVNLASKHTTLVFEHRLEYCRLCKQERMKEFQKQMQAIKKGFDEVVPKSALLLLSIGEIERRVCGDLQVSVLELQKCVTFSYFSKRDQIKIFWDVVEVLSNEERSMLLKFTSGRRRLPVNIDIQSSNTVDTLPTAGTCSNILYLPRFSSFEIALKNIRLAINSCLTIDTDLL